MASKSHERSYAFYATFAVIAIQFIITVIIWVVLRQGPRWVWALIVCEIVALGIASLTVRKLIYSLILEMLSRRTRGVALGPGFGVVGRSLDDREIRNAFPSGLPFSVEPYGDQSSESDAWSAREEAWIRELQAASARVQAGEDRPQPLFTTIGLVRLRDRSLKVAVVNYFRPRRLRRAQVGSDTAITVAGQEFPIVARPWLPVEHSGAPASDGHCWVAFGELMNRYGIVTAQHVVRPKICELGTGVSLETARSVIRGTLREASGKMDASLVEVDKDNVPELMPTAHSEGIGFKPVEIATGGAHHYRRHKGHITGWPGLTADGVFFRQPGGEPLLPAILTFNTFGQEGDSGCVVLDIEFEKRGYKAPYLIYQGVTELGRGRQGYGLLLAQVVAQWNVSIQSIVPREESRAVDTRGSESSAENGLDLRVGETSDEFLG